MMRRAMIQTGAMLLDAYRELNARKLFWISLALSGLIVVMFAAMGINKDGLTIVGFGFSFFGVTSDTFPPEVFYKTIFLAMGVSIWLTWIATALALITTAQVIPDFVASGSIELSLSRPIGRARLFLTKYATGLLFVGLQVAVFSAASFLVIGVRGGAWEPAILLAVPLVVAFYSYIYCVQALIGLLTRSTIASLIGAALFWFSMFILNTGDLIGVSMTADLNARRNEQVRQIERMESNTTVMLRQELSQELSAGEPLPEDWEPTPEQLDEKNAMLPGSRAELARLEKSLRYAGIYHRIVTAVRAPLPKTQETIKLLNRTMIDLADLPEAPRAGPEVNAGAERTEEMSLKIEATLRARSAWYILGTSLGFEVVVLGVCCFVFARRDF